MVTVSELKAKIHSLRTDILMGAMDLTSSKLKVVSYLEDAEKLCPQQQDEVPKKTGFFNKVKGMLSADNEVVSDNVSQTKLQQTVDLLTNCSKCNCLTCPVRTDKCCCYGCLPGLYVSACDGDCGDCVETRCVSGTNQVCYNDMTVKEVKYARGDGSVCIIVEDALRRPQEFTFDSMNDI